MPMSRIATGLTGLALFALAGCSTLTAPPPPAALNGASYCLTVSGPIDSANPSAGYAFEIRARDYTDPDTALADDLDCQLNEIMARQALYNQHYTAIAREQRAINLGSIGAAFLGAGFAAFDAHEDNVGATALTLGGLTVLRNGLNQAELLDAYADGASAMGCYAAPGQQVYRGLRLDHDLELQTFREELEALVAQGHVRLENQPASNGDSDQDKAALRQAMALAGTVISEVRTSRAALNQFPPALARSWRAADSATLGRLRNQAPNIASLIEAAQALTNPGDDAQASGVAGQAPDRAAAAPSDRSAAIITRDLTTLIGDARAFMERNRYPAALAGLAQCQALAAG
ncbi:hypothetical protein [uncultured Maricaulis sp.]|jgi:hypothetical protein|uniref:hypothetical protein n=1 Tax=uncultured Maricaulis sp. TaxID=174710 RepID=UPI0025D7D1E5|nr:hypothetical protein [uncultured Maricaulis sp.]